MTTPDKSPESPPFQEPSLEEQQSRLDTILADHMKTMIHDQEFFENLKKGYNALDPKIPLTEEASLLVSIGHSTRHDEAKSWQSDETLYVGVRTEPYSGTAGTSFVKIAKRQFTAQGATVIAEQNFTQEQAKMIADMTDELLLAKLSGQIPSLHGRGLSKLVVKPNFIDPESGSQ